MDLNAVAVVIAVMSAAAGALSTYVVGRIDRAADMKDRSELRALLVANQRRVVLALQMAGNIYSKLEMQPRFGDELYKVLQLEAGDIEHAGLNYSSGQV